MIKIDSLIQRTDVTTNNNLEQHFHVTLVKTTLNSSVLVATFSKVFNACLLVIPVHLTLTFS